MCLSWDEIVRVPFKVAGVYVLHAFAVEFGGYPAFYVGQSRDLRRRLSEHLSDGSAAPPVRLVRSRTGAYFSAAPVADAKLRFAIESGLIRALTPPCNRQIPNVVPLLPDLPPFTVAPLLGARN